MDILVTRLREVLGLLKPVVPRKPTLDILKSVLIKDHQAVGTDLETMVTIPVPEADEDILIPLVDATEILKYIQGGETLHVTKENGMLKMTWSEGKTSLNLKDVKDYPDVPEFIPLVEAQLDGDTLIQNMMSVLPYAAIEDSRTVLKGVTIELGEPFQIAAGDGYRMAYQVLPLSFPKNMTVIVPSDAVRHLNHFWELTPRSVPAVDSLVATITAKKQILVGFNDKSVMRVVYGKAATAMVKLVQGNPPAFLKLIPKDEPVLRSQFMAAPFVLAVRRALSIAKDGSKIIRLVFNDGTVTVSATGNDQSIESDVKTLATKGGPNKVSLDATYLLEYLKGKEGLVTIAMVSNTQPVMFQHQKDPRVVIMPMMDKDTSPPPAETQPEKEPTPPEQENKSEETDTKKEPT